MGSDEPWLQDVEANEHLDEMATRGARPCGWSTLLAFVLVMARQARMPLQACPLLSTKHAHRRESFSRFTSPQGSWPGR